MIMKRFTYILFFVLLLFSCKENVVEPFEVSLSSYTFNKYRDTLTVNIYGGSWTAESAESQTWAVVERVSDKQALVIVEDNCEIDDRKCVFEFTSGSETRMLEIKQLGTYFEGSFVELPDFSCVTMSKSGKYVAGFKKGEDTEGLIPVVIDTDTEERREFAPVSGYKTIQSISDDGNIIVLHNPEAYESALLKDGNLTEVTLPEYCTDPVIEDMSFDGSVMVGWCFFKSGSERYYAPVRWINMEPEILNFPDVSIDGDKLYSGAMARGCSADGSVIYGSEWDNQGLIYWIDGQMFYPGRDWMDPNTITVELPNGNTASQDFPNTYIRWAERNALSCNGRYLTCSYKYNELVEGTYKVSMTMCPALIDLETQDHIYLKEEIPDGQNNTVTNEGVCFIGTPYTFGNSMNGMVYDYKSGATMTISEWFLAEHGVLMSEDRMVLQVNDASDVFVGRRSMSSPIGIAYKYWYLKL